MELSIDDLLNSLQNPLKEGEKKLENNKDTWERIGNKDAFSELGLNPSELEDFLKEWIDQNGYENI
jgi:hypothetical protein